MIDSLAAALTLACLAAGVIVLATSLTGRYRWQRTAPSLIGGEAVLVAQAGFAVVRLCQGHRPVETTVFIAYLATSVVLLPVAALQVRGRDDRWSSVLLAAACVVLAVVEVRAATTWRS